VYSKFIQCLQDERILFQETLRLTEEMKDKIGEDDLEGISRILIQRQEKIDNITKMEEEIFSLSQHLDFQNQCSKTEEVTQILNEVKEYRDRIIEIDKTIERTLQNEKKNVLDDLKKLQVSRNMHRNYITDLWKGSSFIDFEK